MHENMYHKYQIALKMYSHGFFNALQCIYEREFQSFKDEFPMYPAITLLCLQS